MAVEIRVTDFVNPEIHKTYYIPGDKDRYQGLGHVTASLHFIIFAL